MTNHPCTYCGIHHRYEHELVCGNVPALYPLLIGENLTYENYLRNNFLPNPIQFLKDKEKVLSSQLEQMKAELKAVESAIDTIKLFN